MLGANTSKWALATAKGPLDFTLVPLDFDEKMRTLLLQAKDETHNQNFFRNRTVSFIFWLCLDIQTKLKERQESFFRSKKVQFRKVHNIQKHKKMWNVILMKRFESFSRPDILKILFLQWDWNFFLLLLQLKRKFRSHELFKGAGTFYRRTFSLP